MRPTRFGNRARVFADYVGSRYSFGVEVWPRVEALLSDREHERLVEADTDQRFFLNLSLCGAGAGIALTSMWVWEGTFGGTGLAWGAAAIALAAAAFIAWIAYCFAVTPSERMANLTSAAFDSHVRELYERYGVRAPTTPVEQEAAGRAITALVVSGTPIPEALRRNETSG